MFIGLLSPIVLEQRHDSETLITILRFFKCHFKKRKNSRYRIFKKAQKCKKYIPEL